MRWKECHLNETMPLFFTDLLIIYLHILCPFTIVMNYDILESHVAIYHATEKENCMFSVQRNEILASEWGQSKIVV